MPWSDDFRDLVSLVARGARLEGSASTREVSALRPGLVPLARSHGVVALACRGAESLPADGAGGVDHELRTLALDHARDALSKFAAVLSIDRSLREAGVRAIPFKGPVLSFALHGDPGLRRSADIDVLVHPRDLPVGARVLADLGYRWDRWESAARMRRYARDNCTMELWSDTGEIVDLNWGIVPRYYAAPLSIEPLFERASEREVPGGSLLMLSPEDLYVTLALHAAKHAFERLAWIVDLARLTQIHPEMDWEIIMQRATEARVRRIANLAALLGASVFGAPLPKGVAALVNDDEVAMSLVELIAERLDGVIEEPESDVEGSLGALQLRMRERWSDRVRYLGRLGLTPTVRDWDFVQLPDPLIDLYYLVRPLRLGRDAVMRRVSN